MRRFYALFYRLLPVRRVAVDDRLYLLNDQEIAAIRRRENLAVSLSAIIGGLGVLFTYVPFYLHPEWFPAYTLSISGRSFEIPLAFILYNVLMAAIEILLLTLLNIWCAHEIAVATGFLDYQTKSQAPKQNLLLDIGLEKKNKKILSLGIDPLLGVNRKLLFLLYLIILLKAALTNMLFKFLIQRGLGRYAVQAVQDFAGIPIFAFWNAYGTRLLLREARVIIMGQNLIEELIARMPQQMLLSEEEKTLLSDTLQYIAVSKRDFHQNHYLLTRHLFALFGIEARQGSWTEQDYLKRLSATTDPHRRFCTLVILLGLILDGRISTREKRKIDQLYREDLIPYDQKEMTGIAADFVEGRGIEGLFRRYLDSGSVLS